MKIINEVLKLQNDKHITIISDKHKHIISVSSIIYFIMVERKLEIHTYNGEVYATRMSIFEMEGILGESFIKVNRGCLVSVMAIHDITDNINLSNGESLLYTLRKKKEIILQFHTKQNQIISNFGKIGIPTSIEEYKRHYSSFENMPFAFTDIEMIFDEKRHAVDWIFRYGNPALAKLEKLPLEKLIGKSFGSIFYNMDSKWLRSYERAALCGETIEIIDYSPEIDTYLKVICFPTFKGHCGCILFDIYNIKFSKNSSDSEKALTLYFGNILK